MVHCKLYGAMPYSVVTTYITPRLGPSPRRGSCYLSWVCLDTLTSSLVGQPGQKRGVPWHARGRYFFTASQSLLDCRHAHTSLGRCKVQVPRCIEALCLRVYTCPYEQLSFHEPMTSCVGYHVMRRREIGSVAARVRHFRRPSPVAWMRRHVFSALAHHQSHVVETSSTSQTRGAEQGYPC